MTDLRLYTYVELAAAWKLSPRTVESWVSLDQRKGIRVPRQRVYVRRGVWVVKLAHETALALLRRHQPHLFDGG